LPFLRERGKLAAQVDQVLVALGPVGEERELVADGLLGLGGGGFEREGGSGHGFLCGCGGPSLARPGDSGRQPGAVLPGHQEAGQARFQRGPWGVSSSRMPSAASWSRMASARAKSRAFLAALRSSTRAWIRASSSPEA